MSTRALWLLLLGLNAVACGTYRDLFRGYDDNDEKRARMWLADAQKSGPASYEAWVESGLRNPKTNAPGIDLPPLVTDCLCLARLDAALTATAAEPERHELLLAKAGLLAASHRDAEAEAAFREALEVARTAGPNLNAQIAATIEKGTGGGRRLQNLCRGGRGDLQAPSPADLAAVLEPCAHAAADSTEPLWRWKPEERKEALRWTTDTDLAVLSGQLDREQDVAAERAAHPVFINREMCRDDCYRALHACDRAGSSEAACRDNLNQCTMNCEEQQLLQDRNR